MKSPQRGQVFLLKADSEGKKRPVLIVSPINLNAGNAVSAVPFYSQNTAERRKKPYCVFFEQGECGLDKDCVAKTDEVSRYRLNEFDSPFKPLGEATTAKMQEISQALCYSLGIHFQP